MARSVRDDRVCHKGGTWDLSLLHSSPSPLLFTTLGSPANDKLPYIHIPMIPSNDDLYAALFEARVMNLHASNNQLYTVLSNSHSSWGDCASRVARIIASSPELAPFARSSTAVSVPFSRESMQLLFYLLSLHEQAFVSRLSSEDAARWHPICYELCLMASGVKPCCVIWIGPGYHSEHRAMHLQDRTLAEAWVHQVWQGTIQHTHQLPFAESELLTWLTSVQVGAISAGVATGSPSEPRSWHSFTGRILMYSRMAPPHHLALVRWAFLQPGSTPGHVRMTRSVQSEALDIVPEHVVAAALGYPCIRPATRGLDNLRTACFIYEDFGDSRAVITGFLAALPHDCNAVFAHLRLVQLVLDSIVPGVINLGVRFEPRGVDQGEVNAVQLQRLLLSSGQALYTPSRPSNIGMQDAYNRMRDAINSSLGVVPFTRSYAFCVYWARLQEVDVLCTSNGLRTI